MELKMYDGAFKKIPKFKNDKESKSKKCCKKSKFSKL